MWDEKAAKIAAAPELSEEQPDASAVGDAMNEMLDMTAAEQPEVWEEKAAKIAAAPELPKVSGSVSVITSNIRASQIMEAPPDVSGDNKKKKRCVIS